MKYETMVETLFLSFPELNLLDEDEKEFMSDLKYYSYESIFFKYIIVKACEKMDIAKIKEICVFLEEMAQCEDEDINALFGVTILESLICYPKTLKIIRPYLKEKTLHELVLMENWVPKEKLTSEDLEVARKHFERTEPIVKKTLEEVEASGKKKS